MLDRWYAVLWKAFGRIYAMTTDFESAVWDALKGVKFPGMSRDIVSFGFVHQVQASAGSVVVDLQMSTHNPAAGEKVRDEVERTLRALPGVAEVQVNMNVVKPAAREEAARRRSPRTPA